MGEAHSLLVEGNLFLFSLIISEPCVFVSKDSYPPIFNYEVLVLYETKMLSKTCFIQGWLSSFVLVKLNRSSL